MGDIKIAWEKTRLEEQLRYIKYLKEYESDSLHTEYARGHMHEASYVLINIFGLTDKQILEIERNGGFTNADIDADLDDVFALMKGGK